MAKRPTKRATSAKSKTIVLPEAETVPDEEHPGFVDGIIGEDAADESGFDELTPVPGGPLPPGPIPQPRPFPRPLPQPLPIPQPRVPLPFPRPLPFPIRICGPVSGRYTLRRTPAFPVPNPGRIPRPIPMPAPRPFPGPIPSPRPLPVLPIGQTSVTVRVDVDRFFPQQRISISASRFFPRASAHVIGEVNSDACLGIFNRRVEAQITYRDGNPGLIPGDRMVFEARRTTGFGYRIYKLTLFSGGSVVRTFNLDFQSQYFDPVEFEVDQVADADPPTTTYNTGSHPNRPGGLPAETISLATVYRRAGFDVSMSPNTSVIPTSGTGANNTWSDTEMHNAMVTFWSRFGNRANWAMWVLFARRHDIGRTLGGIMFDDIGPNHRQGTAIFTDSFIQDNPAGDPNPAAWRQRMVFWTAVHEIGHGFNLAHAWQKALGTPWIPLVNEPEARSFMNYPFFVSGGQDAFFSDFEFRFSDDELVFMRHAPRRFVQMGNEDWFENHGFEQPVEGESPGFRLELRPNREENGYKFLEPVTLELKLTNTSDESQPVEDDCLKDGRHVAIVVCREGGTPRKWRPFVAYCHKDDHDMLKPGESVYGAHFAGASTEGWLVDEPGFYKVQAAVDVNGTMVRSNVMRLYVSPPASDAENAVAPDYFSEDVARVLAFQGAPELAKASDHLQEVVKRCGANPAATHAAVALANPKLSNFRELDAGTSRDDLGFKTVNRKVDEASKQITDALLKQPETSAKTMGHIPYFDTLEHVSKCLADAGGEKEAKAVREKAIAIMEKRDVLKSVIDAAKRRLERMKK